jgi:hypothetical protein
MILLNNLNLMQKFIIKLIVITLLTAGIYAMLGNVFLKNGITQTFIGYRLFIAFITLILHHGLYTRRNDGKKFIRYYMGSTGLKLFIYLTTIIIFAFINKPMVIPFALCFFFFYFCFTIFEVLESYGGFREKYK